MQSMTFAAFFNAEIWNDLKIKCNVLKIIKKKKKNLLC